MTSLRDQVEAILSRDTPEQIRSTGSSSAHAADQMARQVVDAAKDFIRRSLQPVIGRIEQIEASRTMVFEGPYDPAKSYGVGAVVQKSGACFVAMVNTSEAPGASSAWRRIASA